MGVPSWITGIFCPALGAVICFFMWCSPFLIVQQAKEKKDIGSVNPLPFFVTFFNCFGWMLYGTMMRDYFIFWANLPGMVLSTYYCLTCIVLLGRKRSSYEQSELYVYFFVFTVFFWGLMMMLEAIVYGRSDYDRLQANLFIGYVACVGGTSYYVAPLSKMAEIVKNRDSSSLYAPTILINLTNATMWFIYGVIAVNDPVVWFPNFVGGVLSIIQLALVAVFPKKQALQEAGLIELSTTDISSLQDSKIPSPHMAGDTENPLHSENPASEFNDFSGDW